MGGQDGNRGYLVQTIIALLESLGDTTWDSVQIEPDERLQKVDILWAGRTGKQAAQVKSSINQIGKADAEDWASSLQAGATAAHYRLILVGPCSQSVLEMGTFQGVEIPCPKSLDINGLLSEAAHTLDKFLEAEGLARQNATQRELMVCALTTHLSALSSNGRAISRSELVALLKTWVGTITGPVSSPWEQVSFDHQRGIESAVAGTRLGPSDTDACPEFAICDQIVTELNRSHLYEVVGTPGCGKSITGWHVARRFQREGFSVWRPRTSARAEDLIASVPRSPRKLLVVDDAQQFGRSFAVRLSEVSGSDTKVLLISTVQDVLQSSVVCISPSRCVEQLATALLNRRDELLPIIRQYDNRVGTGYFDMSYEERVRQARKENTPWMFFWVLRGGWQTARHEFESIQQFAHAADVLLLIAVGQIASCDAGVTLEWIHEHAKRAGIGDGPLGTAIGHLCKLGLVLQQDSIRTKHISYAYRIVEESFRQPNSTEWPRLSHLFVDCILTGNWSLRGVAWALDAINNPEVFPSRTRKSFRAIVEPLTRRCVQERDDLDWAAGCLSRLFSAFEIETAEILAHRDLVLGWATSRCGLVSYFCSGIVNELINRSDKASGEPAREFIASLDGAQLAEVANSVGIDELYSFGSLLDRLGFYSPSWAAQFFERFDWGRVWEMILNANPDRAYAVSTFVAGISILGRTDNSRTPLAHVEAIVPYVSRAINARPCDAVEEMEGVFWTCLGYVPKFLRGGRAPEDDQVRVAKQIVALLEPQSFARAMEKAIPRDLEQLARTYMVIREIDPDFIGTVAGCLSESDFFAAIRDDWQRQSDELDRILRFFCRGKDFEPAATWIGKNKQHINGPLRPLLVCIAPAVAIELHKSGNRIEFAARSVHWQETSFAIKRLAKIDQAFAVEIVKQQLDGLLDAMYKLYLGSAQHIIRFFRTLHELSTDLFTRFVSGLNLDHSTALQTIEKLGKRQPNERREYQKLARHGQQLDGRIAELSTELLRRLEAASSNP